MEEARTQVCSDLVMQKNLSWEELMPLFNSSRASEEGNMQVCLIKSYQGDMLCCSGLAQGKPPNGAVMKPYMNCISKTDHSLVFIAQNICLTC